MTGDPPRSPSARKKSELRRLARAHSEEAFQALVEVMTRANAADHARIFAANTILEWGHGRRGGASFVRAVDESIRGKGSLRWCCT